MLNTRPISSKRGYHSTRGIPPSILSINHIITVVILKINKYSIRVISSRPAGMPYHARKQWWTIFRRMQQTMA